jgi:hypothetical protein
VPAYQGLECAGVTGHGPVQQRPIIELDHAQSLAPGPTGDWTRPPG